MKAAQATDGGGLLAAAIQAQAVLLSPNERRVAEAILEDPQQVVYETVNQPARRSAMRAQLGKCWQRLRAAKQAGALSIAVSSFFHSPLVKAVDIAIVTGNREVSFHEQAMAARAAQFAVLDALIVAAALANPARFATTRPKAATTALSHRV